LSSSKASLTMVKQLPYLTGMAQPNILFAQTALDTILEGTNLDSMNTIDLYITDGSYF